MPIDFSTLLERNVKSLCSLSASVVLAITAPTLASADNQKKLYKQEKPQDIIKFERAKTQKNILYLDNQISSLMNQLEKLNQKFFNDLVRATQTMSPEQIINISQSGQNKECIDQVVSFLQTLKEARKDERFKSNKIIQKYLKKGYYSNYAILKLLQTLQNKNINLIQNLQETTNIVQLGVELEQLFRA